MPVPFDFLINNALLRVSLEKFLNQNSLSTEDILVIEYLPAVSISDSTQSSDKEAWVGSLNIAPNSVICGCYDGSLRICETDKLDTILTIDAHDGPIRAVLSWQDAFKNQFVVSGSKDQSIKCWDLNIMADVPFANNICSLLGPVNSVESLEVFGRNATILAGDWSGNVFAYDGSRISSKKYSDQKLTAEDNYLSSRKKRRKDLVARENDMTESPEDLSPLFSLRAHTQAVSGISACRDDLNSGTDNNLSEAHNIFTSGWDHSIKLWDIESQNCIATYMGPKIVTSMQHSRRANAVATAHPDGRVRLWDSRQRESVPPIETFGATEQWIAGVSCFLILLLVSCLCYL